jgi:site-specific recombinase XerC
LLFLEFFAANIRNPYTRRAYARAADEFLAWSASVRVPSIAAVQPAHVAKWIEASTHALAAPSVKQRLAALRHLFDCLGRVVPVNPAHTVRGPRHVVTSGQMPVLDPEEGHSARQHRHVDAGKPARSRADRADGLFIRPISATLGLVFEDVSTPNHCLWVRLREKGGKRHDMPCHHDLEECLTAYLDGAKLRSDPSGRGTGRLTRTVPHAGERYAMIRRRAAAAGITTKLSNHDFRATGITAYLKNGGTLEKRANPASTRMTQL